MNGLKLRLTLALAIGAASAACAFAFAKGPVDVIAKIPWSWPRLARVVDVQLLTHLDIRPSAPDSPEVETYVWPTDVFGGEPNAAGPRLFIWPERELERLSTSELADIAGRVDVVLRDTREERVRAVLKASNPRVRLVGYLNAIWTWNYDDHMWKWSEISQRTDWFLKDTRGRQILSTCCGNPFGMDPGNASWQEYLAEAAIRGLRDGLDGVYVDDVHEIVPGPRVDEAWPINPRTGLRFTDEEWNASTLELMERVYALVRSSYPNPTAKLVLYNGDAVSLRDAPRILQSVDGIIIEGFAHPYWKRMADVSSERQWKSEVDTLVGVQRQGKAVLAIAGTADGDRQEVNLFTYSSYLLGKGPNSFYNFANFDYEGAQWPGFFAPIGIPSGTYYRSQEVFHRDFTGAKVLVNPTASPRQVGLDKGYHRVDKDGGVKPDLVEGVDLPPHTGAILLRADGYSPR